MPSQTIVKLAAGFSQRLPFSLLAVIVILLAAPVAAQNAETLDYPTVAALDAAVLPVRDRVELAQRLRGVIDIPAPPTSAPTRKVGDQQVFTAANSTDNFTFEVPATLRVVGEHIYLWVENDADIRDADLQALADAFDSFIYASVRDLWGSEPNPGIDGDPRIYGLFTHGLGASTAAYFASDHAYPPAVLPSSNGHEMFFFNLDAFDTEVPLLAVESIIAHEFQHMIRFNLQMNEQTWLNEGFSEFTQYYLYNQLDSSLLSFLNAPNTQLNDWNAEPGKRAANYGAASMFLIYFYQRYGLDAMRALSADSSARGLQAVDNVLRVLDQPGVDELFADWVLANTLYDPSYGDGRYGYPGLPPLLTPPPLATVNSYPFARESEANQYATDYFVLTNLDRRESLDLRLEAPASVGLIPLREAESFWYSNRGDMSDTRLTRAFDLTDVTKATLNYRLWYDTEAFWDYGYLMVSTDGGTSWDILPTPHTTLDNPHDAAYGAGYSGASRGWISESVALDAYAGGQILVRFESITDDAVNRPGLAIDDVNIPEIGYSADFQTGGEDWLAEGWLWTDNRLPQQAWLQVAQQIGSKTASVERWRFDGTALDQRVALVAGVDQVVVAISPFAPVTTVPMPYGLKVD